MLKNSCLRTHETSFNTLFQTHIFDYPSLKAIQGDLFGNNSACDNYEGACINMGKLEHPARDVSGCSTCG